LHRNTSYFDIYKICSYINDNIKTVTLCSAAQFSGYSENYFSTLFKNSLGSGFKQYVDFVRFRRAEHMMIMSDMNVSEIADTLGFDSVQNFSRSFKRIVGSTPTEYIKKFRIITEIAIRPKE